MRARVVRCAVFIAAALLAAVVLPSLGAGPASRARDARAPAQHAVSASGIAINAVAADTLSLPVHAQIVTGGAHACSLDTSGGVRCWGDNSAGELGDGTQVSRSRPGLVTGLDSGVVQLALGSAHSCALTVDGGVKCWGNNADGELGDFTQANRDAPVDVIGLSSGVVSIAAGDRHTCALLGDGTMDCWGYNALGEAGNGTSGNDWLGALAVCASGSGFGCAGGSALQDVAFISAGGVNTCAVTTVGALFCWGGNYNGQLGQGFAPDKPVPDNNVCPTAPVQNAACLSLPAAVPGLDHGMARVSAGDTTCATTTTGGAQCWGFNAHGEVGDGTTSPVNPNVNLQLYPPSFPQPTPQQVSGLVAGVQQIENLCALTAQDGVMCWGDNALGEVGDGTTTDRTVPTDVSGLTSGVTEISARSAAACAVGVNDALFCWGSNGSGQVGAATSDTCVLGISCAEDANARRAVRRVRRLHQIRAATVSR